MLLRRPLQRWSHHDAGGIAAAAAAAAAAAFVEDHRCHRHKKREEDTRTSVRNNWCDCCLSQSIIKDEEKVNHIKAVMILPMNSYAHYYYSLHSLKHLGE